MYSSGGEFLIDFWIRTYPAPDNRGPALHMIDLSALGRYLRNWWQRWGPHLTSWLWADGSAPPKAFWVSAHLPETCGRWRASSKWSWSLGGAWAQGPGPGWGQWLCPPRLRLQWAAAALLLPPPPHSPTSCSWCSRHGSRPLRRWNVSRTCSSSRREPPWPCVWLPEERGTENERSGSLSVSLWGSRAP